MVEFVGSLLKRVCTNCFKSDRQPLVFGLAGPASVGNRPETYGSPFTPSLCCSVALLLVLMFGDLLRERFGCHHC